MKYKLEDITIKIIDVAAEARQMYGDKVATEIANGFLPEHDYRFEAIADNGTNKTSVTFARGSVFRAENILRYLNRE